MEKKAFSQKIVRSGAWVFSLRILQQLLELIKVIILARLLSPWDFGLMGIGILLMGSLRAFSQIGFQTALIQKKENTHKYLDTAWTILVIRGFILFAIFSFMAPWAADFFRAPQMKVIVPIMGISLLLTAFVNIGTIHFEKELKFYKYFIQGLCGCLVNFIVTVLAALIMRNFWALIIGMLAGEFVEFIFSYLIHPYRPHFNLDLDKTRYLFDFGKWILFSTVLMFLFTQGGDFFVGKILGLATLGFYRMAYKISNTLPTEVGKIVRSVTFPAYSRLQDELAKLRETYLKVLQLVTFVSLPLAGGILILGSEFTKLFLGSRWMPIVPTMQILAVFGILRLIGETTETVFISVGKPGMKTRLQFAQFILLAVLIYPLTKYLGIAGTALAVTLCALIFSFVALHKMINVIETDYSKVIKIITFPFIATLIMIFVIFVMKYYVFGAINVVFFFFFCLIALFTYLFIIYLFDLFLNYGVRQLIKQQFTALFSRT